MNIKQIIASAFTRISSVFTGEMEEEDTSGMETNKDRISVPDHMKERAYKILKQPGLKPILTWEKSRTLRMYFKTTQVLEFIAILSFLILTVCIACVYRIKLANQMNEYSLVFSKLKDEIKKKNDALLLARREEMLRLIIDSKLSSSKMEVLNCKSNLDSEIAKSLDLYNQNQALKRELSKAAKKDSLSKLLKNAK